MRNLSSSLVNDSTDLLSLFPTGRISQILLVVLVLVVLFFSLIAHIVDTWKSSVILLSDLSTAAPLSARS